MRKYGEKGRILYSRGGMHTLCDVYVLSTQDGHRTRVHMLYRGAYIHYIHTYLYKYNIYYTYTYLFMYVYTFMYIYLDIHVNPGDYRLSRDDFGKYQIYPSRGNVYDILYTLYTYIMCTPIYEYIYI